MIAIKSSPCSSVCKYLGSVDVWMGRMDCVCNKRGKKKDKDMASSFREGEGFIYSQINSFVLVMLKSHFVHGAISFLLCFFPLLPSLPAKSHFFPLYLPLVCYIITHSLPLSLTQSPPPPSPLPFSLLPPHSLITHPSPILQTQRKVGKIPQLLITRLPP